MYVLVLVLVLDGPLLAALLGAANPMEGGEQVQVRCEQHQHGRMVDVVQGHPANTCWAGIAPHGNGSNRLPPAWPSRARVGGLAHSPLGPASHVTRWMGWS